MSATLASLDAIGLRALSAWDRAGCASCASRIAIVDAHASGCADCADGGAS